MKITYRVHAVRRMFERHITDADVANVLATDEEIVITVYEPDAAFWDDGFRRRKP